MTNNERYFQDMKNRIFAMKDRGYTIEEICYVIRLSEELVNQILNTYKKEILK